MSIYTEVMPITSEPTKMAGTSEATLDSCQTIEEQLDWLFCNLFGAGE